MRMDQAVAALAWWWTWRAPLSFCFMRTALARHCERSVQPGDMTDGCSETWLTRQNWQDSSNKGASHAVARGVCHGPATRVRNACQAGWSKPAEAVPAVQHQCPDRIQVD